MQSESAASGGLRRENRPAAGRTCLVWLLVGVCHVAAAAAEGDLPLAMLVEGEPLPARLASIYERWEIVFQTAAGTRKVSATELVAWGNCVEAGRGPWIVLHDGSVIVGDLQHIDREHLAAKSRIFGAVRLMRASVAGVVSQSPGDRDERDRLLNWVVAGATRGEALGSGRLRFANDDEVGGTLDRLVDGKIAWHGDLGPLEIEFDRLRAVRLGASPPRAAQPQRPRTLTAWTGWRDGARLLVANLVTIGNNLRVTLSDGTAWDAALGDLIFLQPQGGRAVYLSDLTPESFRHLAYLALAWPLGADRNAAGGFLRSGGAIYLKGLGMHSASRVTYFLTEPYRRFQAEVAIDDRTEGGGSVAFRVFVDGQLRYASPVVRGGQAPLPVAVDLAGAQRLDLVVDFAERADELDHADWLNARLIR